MQDEEDTEEAEEAQEPAAQETGAGEDDASDASADADDDDSDAEEDVDDLGLAFGRCCGASTGEDRMDSAPPNMADFGVSKSSARVSASVKFSLKRRP